MGGEAGVSHLARWLFAKPGVLPSDSTYEDAVKEARKMLKTSGGGDSSQTREEYEASVRARYPDASEDDIQTTVEAKYGG